MVINQNQFQLPWILMSFHWFQFCKLNWSRTRISVEIEFKTRMRTMRGKINKKSCWCWCSHRCFVMIITTHLPNPKKIDMSENNERHLIKIIFSLISRIIKHPHVFVYVKACIVGGEMIEIRFHNLELFNTTQIS